MLKKIPGLLNNYVWVISIVLLIILQGCSKFSFIWTLEAPENAAYANRLNMLCYLLTKWLISIFPLQIIIMPIRRSAAAPPKEDTPPAPAPESGMHPFFARSLFLHLRSQATGKLINEVEWLLRQILRVHVAFLCFQYLFTPLQMKTPQIALCCTCKEKWKVTCCSDSC